ncbi:hypothetical protein RDWZM_006802 [Blomia tropicalis]|uniref:Acetyl-CoA hydrolase n=1 Tax=Blomia tropicalis TaxID=40697 RepID=A0A9Q0RNX9_BLOTA|nr:hypothetical protein RDWZM_006802 [Blomia tropicalis]
MLRTASVLRNIPSLSSSSSPLSALVSRNFFSYANEPTHPIPGKEPKRMTASEAVSVVKSGDHVFIHGAAATPRALVPALAEHGKKSNLKDVKVHHIHTEGAGEYNGPEFEGIFRSNSLFTGANSRVAISEGRADFTPIFLGEIPQLFKKGIITPDVALVSISPADEHGFHSLGTSVDVARAAIMHSKYIVGQVNPRLPRTFGHAIVHTSHFDALVDGAIDLPDHPPKVMSEAEKKIGQLIANNLVEDGATMQMGIGAIPDAVLADLTGHKDLGIHSEMFSDGVVDLCHKGVITNRYKKLQTGRITASFLIGSKKLYEFVDNNPYIVMLGIDYVNDEFNVAQNPKVTAVNSCIEIDIVGQICADSIGTRVYSGFGGQVDFLRGAAKGLDGKGKPILAMTSVTNKGVSKIAVNLKPGAPVVTTRAHAHYIVTEYGIAYLFGKNYRQRAHALIQIAHPDHREALERGAFERLKCRNRDYERRYRYWSFLFDHLNRIIDEIYQNCERDESIDQCKETILTLENHVADFRSLIEWLKLNKNLETTPQRPNSVSWEVRKRMPKNPLWSYYLDFDSHKGELELMIYSMIQFAYRNVNQSLLFTLFPSNRVCDNKCNNFIKEIIEIENESPKFNANVDKTQSEPTNSVKSSPNSQTLEKPINGHQNGESYARTVSSNNHKSEKTPANNKPQETRNVRTEPKRNQSNQTKSGNKKPISYSTSPPDNMLNRCNSFNVITRNPKYDLDEDGFRVVRYKQRNKVTQLKIITNPIENGGKHISNNNGSDSWSSYENNVMGDSKTPCRALQLHEKFLSPSRKRSINETLRKQEEKQAKAQEAREKLLEMKARKFKGIVKKVEEIRAQKEEQQMQLKLSMEMRLQKADEKRQQQINRIVRKAHDEDSKVNEILFINSLEADSKKHEIFNKEKVSEMRLQDLQEERLRKLEEKASKEAAFEKRRQAIEAEKQARIEMLKEQRKMKVMKIQMQQQEREKERLELAFQKELERKTKLSALSALHAAEKEELQKKILAKQEESKRRHEENMEQIRQKALELSVRKSSSGVSDDALVCVPYDTIKMCALCKVMIKSEVYLFGHLRGKRHNDAIKEQNNGKIPSVEELEDCNLRNIIDASLHPDASLTNPFQDCDNEKLKQARKKSKKLKNKIVQRVTQYEEKYENQSVNSFGSMPKDLKYKFARIIKDSSNLHSNESITGQWPTNMIRSLERMLSDLDRLFQSDSRNIEYFHSVNGIQLITQILSRILNGTTERPTSLTDNANNKLIALYQRACISSWDICDFFLNSTNIISLLDILFHRLNVCINSNVNSYFPYDSVVGSLCEFFSATFDKAFQHFSSKMNNSDKQCTTMIQHINDIINYLVLIGVIDKLSIILSSIRGSVNELPPQALFVKQIITLLSAISKLLTLLPSCDHENIGYGLKLTDDDTQFMLTLRVNQLCGIVSLLYGFLLHSGTPIRDDNVPILVPEHTLQIALEAIRFFNFIALLDINLIQSILGGEGLSLQIRHICSYLIWYCSHHHHSNTELLHEVIVLIGNFVVLNTDNQNLLQLGQRPTVVQQLCSLPFEYFSEPTLVQILFPTLIVCCFKNEDNMNVLKQEMSTSMLSSFIEQTIVRSQMEQLENENKNRSIEKWSLSIRFPKSKWSEAKFYFEDMK